MSSTLLRKVFHQTIFTKANIMHTHIGKCEPEFLGVHFISISLFLFLSATYTMVEECPRLALIKQELEVALAKSRRLEDENEQLKQEVAFLKAQARRRSSPVKHLQITSLANDQSQQEKGSMEINLPEEFYTCSYRPPSPDLIAAKNGSPRTPKLPPNHKELICSLVIIVILDEI